MSAPRTCIRRLDVDADPSATVSEAIARGWRLRAVTPTHDGRVTLSFTKGDDPVSSPSSPYARPRFHA